jgi:hypothetical protein
MKSLSKFFLSILSLSLLAVVFTIPVQAGRTTTYSENAPKTDCNITDLVVEYECDGDEIFYVTIDFNIANPGNAGFKVQGNGINHGSFEYADLPITIGPLEADCHTNWEFVVKDLQFPNCAEDTSIGVVCCGAGGDCNITDLVVEYECDGDEIFYVTIDFNIANPGNAGFKVQGNGINHGSFEYADLPITIGPLEADCHTNWEFVVKDLQFPNCAEDTSIGVVCCGAGGDCNITDLVVEYECDGDEIFYVTIDFNIANPGNQGFKVFGKGMDLGVFDYANLPITIGPLEADCITSWGFLIKDLQYPHCAEDISLGKVCCGGGGDCGISELVVEYECDGDSLFYVTLDFNVVNPGNEGFKVFGNGVNYGTFDYADLPITIGPLHVDCKKVWEFAVKDNQDPHCFKVVDLGKVCCEGGGGDCKITELVAAYECDGDSLFYVTLDFNIENPGNEGFKVFGNGVNYGTFDYADLPITIGPLHVDCKKVWEFVVKDNQDPQCFKVVDLGKVCCEEAEFQIKDLKLTKGACLTDTTYQLLVNFKHDYGDPFIFKIWFNGNDYGTHSTAELPILFDVKARVSVKEKLQMCMAANPGQCMQKYYDAPKCIGKSNSWISNGNQEAAQSASSQKLITNDTGSFQFLIGSTMYNFKSTLSIKELRQVSVLDLTGRIIYSQKTDGEGYLMTLDVPFTVASGLYYIKVDTDSGSEAYQFILMR